MLDSPRDRALAGASLAVFLAGARAARRTGVAPLELRWFHAVNGLPRQAFAPVWVVMQLGSLGGAVLSGAALRAVGRRDLGARVAATGAATWLGVKAVKPFVRRGRPALAVGMARVLGHEQGGLGYPSGHAAVAASIAAVVAPEVPARWRAAAWGVAMTVGPARCYVGAHLPLDVVGGAALGVAIGVAARRPRRNGRPAR